MIGIYDTPIVRETPITDFDKLIKIGISVHLANLLKQEVENQEQATLENVCEYFLRKLNPNKVEATSKIIHSAVSKYIGTDDYNEVNLQILKLQEKACN